MSRIGRAPIAVPAGVEIKIEDNNVVTVKGPKGTLTQKFHPNMSIKQEGAEIVVARPNDAKENRSLHGLTRTLVHNMVVGVTDGYKKELDVNGVGYRVAMDGKKLKMNLGFSHDVIVEPVEGITIEAPSPNKRTAVYRYLLVLFGAAFILLLLAYFIQQRSSETAISDLRDSMNLSRAELMEEIDGLREENEQHKATIQELEEAEKAATDLRDALQQEFIALDDRHIETSLNLYRATALSFLERFCAGEDWLMAACVVEDCDKLFNRHDPKNTGIGLPPAAVEDWYFRLREQTLDEAGSLVVEQFGNEPEDENYTEQVYILAEHSRYGPEAVAAARKLWIILEPYSYRDYPAAAIELEKFCNSDPQYQGMLESGAFQPDTVELFQQIKDELKQSGLIAEDEDGTIKLTSGDADNPG